jgi:two-component system, sensor histidine kinase LadS
MMQFLALLGALFSGKANKCMRWRWALAWVALLVGFSNNAWADHAAALVIADTDVPHLQGSAHFWHEKPAQATIEQAASAAAAGRYMPLSEETMFDLRAQDRLWVRLDLERKGNGPEHWVLWLPLPLIDSVTVYQQQSDGKWQSWRAGDRVAVATWPEPGRYPRFHLELPQGKSQVFMQIQGSTPLSIPLYVGTEVPAQNADRQGFLGMGLVLGVLLTLVLMCMVTAYTYRDRLYLLYGLYMLVMVLAVGAYTGLSGYLLWNHSPWWTDTAQGVLAIFTAGGAMYFIEAMLGGRQFARRLSVALLSLGVSAVPLALVYAWVPRSIGVIILGVYMALVTTVGVALAIRAWRLGDPVGKWICLAYAPLSFAVLLAIARAYGWIIVSWVVQYGVVVALLIEAPMMMVALHARSRQRHEIRTREQALNTQDALTGLLTEYIFDDRIKQTTARAIKRKEDAAIVLISLVNYESIVHAHGLPVAEQSILRAVIKLRKVVRDVGTVARVGTSHFGLILEGVGHRSRVTDIGARLIAQGLMPLPGLVPEVTLHFHLAAIVLREIPGADQDIKGNLLALLKNMSPRTRRPIRFLQTLSTNGAPLPRTNKPSPVDALVAQVKAAEHQPKPIWQPITKNEQPSSGSHWSGGQSSMPSQEPETIQQT